MTTCAETQLYRARRPGLAPLAGKSTLNRLEHAPAGPDRYRRIGQDPAAIEARFVDLFLDAHGKPPARITIDLDATDDPIQGRQEGRFFHGYDDACCYRPLYIFCGDHLLAAKLRRSSIDASAGATEEIARIVARIRARSPREGLAARRQRLRPRRADGVVRGRQGGLPVRPRPQRAPRRSHRNRPTSPV